MARTKNAPSQCSRIFNPSTGSEREEDIAIAMSWFSSLYNRLPSTSDNNEQLLMIKSTCNLLTQTNTISRSPPSLARHSPSSCPVSTSGPSGSRLSRSSRYYYIMNDSQISFITPYLSPGEAAPQHLPGALHVHGGAPELGHLLQVSDAH